MEELKRKFIECYLKILLLQAAFLILMFIFFTVLRFADYDLFNEVRALYSEYFKSDVSITLVIGD